MRNIKRALIAASMALSLPFSAQATEVQIQTVLGNINVNLFDEDTPQTVDNFLSYVNSGAYAKNIFHRAVPNFVIQGGGFMPSTTNGVLSIDPIATDSPVANEPKFSNVRGTIAMAKLGGNPNSATSQWFISLANNSANLDVQNGGFTVFGQVLGDGMDVVEQIAALQSATVGGFRDFPLRDTTAGATLTEDNLVIITDIVVIDDATVTNPDIVPVENTRINAPTTPPAGQDDGGGSGGSTGLWLLALLGLSYSRRK